MRKLKMLMITISMGIFMGFSSFAGEWRSDAKGWWYAEDNGSYPVSQWKEINGKYYYFGTDGYMLANTITPDGYKVREDGAWIQETNVQDTGYLEKYAEILQKLIVKDRNETNSFKLIYVDEDSIPELLVFVGYSKTDPYLYTYSNGEAKLLGHIPNDGWAFSYVEHGNLFHFSIFYNGGCQKDDFYTIVNGEMIQVVEFVDGYHYMGGFYQDYAINDQQVSKSTYENQLNAMKNGYFFKKVNFNAFHKINKENIQKMLVDMNSAM